MSTEPEPGSAAWQDEQKREHREHEIVAYNRKRRDLERRMDNLAMSASVIAAGVATRMERKPVEIAAEAVDIAIEIFERSRRSPTRFARPSMRNGTG